MSELAFGKQSDNSLVGDLAGLTGLDQLRSLNMEVRLGSAHASNSSGSPGNVCAQANKLSGGLEWLSQMAGLVTVNLVRCLSAAASLLAAHCSSACIKLGVL